MQILLLKMINVRLLIATYNFHSWILQIQTYTWRDNIYSGNVVLNLQYNFIDTVRNKIKLNLRDAAAIFQLVAILTFCNNILFNKNSNYSYYEMLKSIFFNFVSLIDTR